MTTNSKPAHRQDPHLCFTHVTLQEVIVHDYRGVLDVEVTGNPPQLSHIQVPALLIKARHLALLQLTRCITHQCLPATQMHTHANGSWLVFHRHRTNITVVAALTQPLSELLLLVTGVVVMTSTV